ncbi:type II secretion system protein [Candidatus Saccharibacteria bacterium]|nr:type II secretion system protein [Candidatus Saccharibacteria bacterium]
MSTQYNKKGFTIIEVVLVLAIAGLIFMMVFLALPALQRSQRDTQRRDDMARFAAQIAQYQTNNRGRVPDTDANPGLWVTTSDHADLGSNVQKDPADKLTLNKDNKTGSWGAFLDSYMWAANDDFTDPGGTPYAVGDHGLFSKLSPSGDPITQSDASGKPLTEMDFIIHVYHGAICGTTEGTVEKSTSGSTRKLAFIYKLEGSGFYCGEV